LVPPPGAAFGVISDVDDTVLQTHATSYLKAAQVTFLQNARMRLPFAGVAAFYRALQAGPEGTGHNPIFYLSSSPWNLYDLLTDFMKLQQIPAGPLLLRDVGIDQDKFISTSHHAHKLGQIERVFQTHPDLDFILIGDSGQKDPEIYAEVVEKYGDRVLGVYVRDVTQAARDDEVRQIAAGVPAEMHLVADSLTAARHAAEQGWIAGRAVDAVEAETHVDEAEPDEVERLLDQENGP
jgi:phosphatidate phosphatase APP1